MIAAAVIIPAAVFAWGPSRQTFTTAAPADYITFNSITDNPAHGDERNFVQVREASASNTTYADEISLSAGKEYVMYMYYHNNAASNLNLVATGSYAKAEIPAVVPNGSNGTKAVGYVGATNANPTQVWDDVSFKNTTGGDIALRYVPGSATIHNFGATDGATLSDNIITSGATLGYNALDGKIPGCNEFAGYVTFRIKADQPNFTVSKQVRAAGTATWSENVATKNGDTVDYQIEYKNTGTTEQSNVVLKDVLPQGVEYIPGSTYLKNASNSAAKNVSDNLVTAGGINIGNYTPGSNAFVKFSAKVNTKEADLKCGDNVLKNVASANTNNGSKSDDANVTVNKKCEPGKITVCELATKKIITIKESEFDTAKYTKDLSKCADTPVTPPVTPPTPPELPQTGVGENIVAVLGLGALIASVGYYIASRRALGL
jgi:uncharacterized repeat protein (TIGR01451 family)/LPXTG-motif cell wall-anchored protein